ncbi:hypothetical protein YC2023_102157 [Brassica napus]
MRLRTSRKSWRRKNNLIGEVEHEKAILLLCKAEAKEQFLGFMISKTKLFSLRFDVHEKFTVKEILDSFNQVEISEVLVCDGLLLCVTVTRDEYSQRLMLWNPYLGQTRWIQTRRSYDRSDVYALGYDKSTNRNHKILMYCYGYKEDECEIYDVKSDSWRTLDVKLHWGWGEEYFHVSASLKGNTYFLDRDGHDEMFTGFLEEKLAALYMRSPISGMGIWVTTKTEPNKLLWSNFFKINLEAIPRTSRFRTRSFFIDEEKKRFFFFLMAVLPIPSPRRSTTTQLTSLEIMTSLNSGSWKN